MSAEATAQIRQALQDENTQRRRRGRLLLGVWGALSVALCVGLGIRRDLAPVEVLAAVVTATFLLFGALTAVLPHLRFGPWPARGIAFVALASPLLAARALGSTDSALAAGFGCMGTIVALGLLALVIGRVVQGRYRRRFGGAPLLQGVAAALVGALAVGLHCPLSEGLHLATHVAGGVVVAAVLRRLTLST